MRFAVIARTQTSTNLALAESAPAGVEALLVTPEEALDALRPGDVALGRLDVLPTLDGVEDGLWCLGVLEARGVRVLNGAPTLLATHDKLLTARLLQGAGVPHPWTRHVRRAQTVPERTDAVVLKPRHGSWGREVHRCADGRELRERLAALDGSVWFRRFGALLQELVAPAGYDVRLVVAGGAVVGAASRHAAPGEWRTNVALGARRAALPEPDPGAVAVARRAAAAVAGDLVGVDLLPDGAGGWVVIEVNGAVEFNETYAPWCDVHARAVAELLGRGRSRPARARAHA